MQKLRYYAAPKAETKAPPPAKAVHSEFLRTGRISRSREDWLPDERRYLTYEEVAARTGRRLERAAETTHDRINSFHRSIKFPKIIFHRTLNNSPHLGYCHVTAARTNFAQYADVKWAFYIANFFAQLGGSEVFFEQIKPLGTVSDEDSAGMSDHDGEPGQHAHDVDVMTVAAGGERKLL